MINIFYYNNITTDCNIVNEIANSFNVSIYDLNLINNKTIIINILFNKIIIGSICLIDNDILYKYLLKKGISSEELNGTYIFRASKGMYIYNMYVNEIYRKKGFGKKLLEIAIYVSSQLNFNFCYSHCENKTSYYIFNNRGFMKENQFKNNKNKDIILMSYWLK